MSLAVERRTPACRIVPAMAVVRVTQHDRSGVSRQGSWRKCFSTHRHSSSLLLSNMLQRQCVGTSPLPVFPSTPVAVQTGASIQPFSSGTSEARQHTTNSEECLTAEPERRRNDQTYGGKQTAFDSSGKVSIAPGITTVESQTEVCSCNAGPTSNARAKCEHSPQSK